MSPIDFSSRPILVMLAGISLLGSGCMVKINRMGATSAAAVGSDGASVRILSPASDFSSSSLYTVFAGSCTAGVNVNITYPAGATPTAWGPSSTPCTASGTFAVGINFAGSTGNRTLQFSQAGSSAALRTVSYGISGLNQGIGPNGVINAMAWDSVNHQIYLGGTFTTFNQMPFSYLVRLNSDGTVDSGFIPAGAGLDNAVHALAWDSANSKLIVGGDFTSYTNGAVTAQNRLTRINRNGAVDTSLVPAGGGVNGRVSALAWDSANSKLYVGGSFTTYTNGAATTQNYLTRLNSDGTVDTGFVPSGGGTNGRVSVMTWDSGNSQLYVGGYFTSYTNGGTTASS